MSALLGIRWLSYKPNWQAATRCLANHVGWDKCDGFPKMVIAFSWKSTQVCLYTTCMWQHIAHAVPEHLEKAVQSPSTSLFTDLPRGHQMACYFLLITVCHQQRIPVCESGTFQRCEIYVRKVWHPFCSVSGARMSTQATEGCYFNLHTIATHFSWLMHNAPDTSLHGKCSIFARQTILWKMVFVTLLNSVKLGKWLVCLVCVRDF